MSNRTYLTLWSKAKFCETEILQFTGKNKFLKMLWYQNATFLINQMGNRNSYDFYQYCFDLNQRTKNDLIKTPIDS